MLNLFNLQPANDTTFALQRNRSLPILSTITPVPNFPTSLRIYLTNASRYWQVKCYLRGHTYTKSLRTTNKRTALQGAKYFYQLKVAELFGDEIVKKEDRKVFFADIVNSVIAEQQIKSTRGEITSEGVRIFSNRIHKTIAPYFNSMAIESIGQNTLSAFAAKLFNENLTPTTVQQLIVAVRKVLAYAYAQNLITSVPKAPNIKTKHRPRGSFDLQEYRLLVKTARSHIGLKIPLRYTSSSRRNTEIIDRYAVVSWDLSYLIRFMVNTFVRPSDIKNLKHKHITVVRGKYTYLRMNLPESKKHDKPIVSMHYAVAVYLQLQRHYELEKLATEDDYVFLPSFADRDKALEFLGWQFKHIQQLAGIGANAANGQTRTLYSLRHTSLTFRLLYGQQIDLLTLARNARTSLEMIEKFYSSNLSAEMNIDLIQGKR